MAAPSSSNRAQAAAEASAQPSQRRQPTAPASAGDERAGASPRGHTLSPTADAAALAVATAAALAVRLYRIFDPAAVVFDEKHFGRFALLYLRSRFFFDVHPPLGKMTFAAAGCAVGMLEAAQGSGFGFDDIGAAYPPELNHAALRAVSAVAGAALVPLCWGILSRLGFGPLSRVAAAAMLAFDNALVTASRVVMLDAQLLLFTFAAVYFAVGVSVRVDDGSNDGSEDASSSAEDNDKTCGASSFSSTSAATRGGVDAAEPSAERSTQRWRSPTDQRREFTVGFFASLAAAGLALGCAASVKLVGLGAAAVVGLHAASQLWEVWGQWRHPIGRFAAHVGARFVLLGCLPAAVYFGLWVAHLRLVPLSGPGDSFVSRRFQQTIVGNGFAAAAAAAAISPSSTATGAQQLQTHSTVSVRRMYGEECWLTVTGGLESGTKGSGLAVRCIGNADGGAATLSSRWWELVPAPTAVGGTAATGGDAGLYHNSVTLLRHVSTGVFLTGPPAGGGSGGSSRDGSGGGASLAAASPLGVLVPSDVNHTGDLASALWRIEILGQDSSVLHLSTSLVRFVHVGSTSALQCTNTAVGGESRVEAAVFPCVAGPNLGDTTGGWHFDTAASHPGNDNNAAAGGPAAAAVSPSSSSSPTAGPDSAAPVAMSDLDKIVELHGLIFRRNSELSGQHRFGSRPHEWPLLSRGILFWHNGGDKQRAATGCGRQVYMMGNPAVWWLAAVAVPTHAMLELAWAVGAKGGAALGDEARAERSRVTAGGRLLLAGWAVHYVPFFFFGRLLFLHHYLPALCFSVLLAAVLVETATLRLGRFGPHAVAALVAVVAGVSARFAGVASHADELCEGDLARLRWLPTWDFHAFEE